MLPTIWRLLAIDNTTGVSEWLRIYAKGESYFIIRNHETLPLDITTDRLRGNRYVSAVF